MVAVVSRRSGMAGEIQWEVLDLAGMVWVMRADGKAMMEEAEIARLKMGLRKATFLMGLGEFCRTGWMEEEALQV